MAARRIRAFILVVGERFDSNVMQSMAMIMHVYGKMVFNNLMIVRAKFSHDPRNLDRLEDQGVTLQSLSDAW